MASVVLRNGLVVHPDGTEIADVLIVDGRIAAVGRDVGVDPPSGSRTIDATGCWVGPGFVDLHTHLREPGDEAAETIASGARAAAVGGFTAVLAMPNTEPALDNVALVTYVLDQGSRAVVDVAVAGAITMSRAGERLAPLAELAALGVRLFTDDGVGVQNAAVMRRALRYARPLGVRLAQHCEDAALAADGSMNEGALSSRLGLVGRPSIAEEVMVARDLALVRSTGAPLHFLHVSTARSLDLIVRARAEGLPVSCEVAPHHFTLDESACATYDANFKVNPPLRSVDDVEAVRRALRGGDVDAVATDHAPHAPQRKDLPFDEAPAGVLGLEHAASLTYEALGAVGSDPQRFFAVLSRNPATIAQLRQRDARPRHGAHGGAVEVGDDGNLVVFDPSERWVARREGLQSRATNSPYLGRPLVGRVRCTVVNGAVVLDEGELT